MVCSEILENALGHMGGEATCKDKAVCSRCEKEYGEFASHTKLNDATCTEDSICMVCSEILENALGHMGGEATCKDKAVCTRCEEEYGDFANHTELNEVTCIDDSICSVCFEVIETAKGHTYLNGKICKDCDHIDYYSPYLYEYNEETTNLYDDSFKKEIIGTLIYTEDLLTIEYTTKITERYNITFVGETVDFDNPEINDIDSLEFLGFVKTDDGYLKQEENEITTIKIIGENIGYFEAVTTIEESTKFKDVVLNENKLSYVDDNGNTIIVLKFEDGTFIKAEPTVSITYKFDGKKYNENFYEDGYVTINGTLGIEKWYGVNGEEYEANQKIFIGKNAVLYNKAYTITAYINGEYIKTVYGCDEFSKYILNTDEQVGYEFIGWKVDENIYSENEIVFPENGMFTAECVYEKTETVAPTINENGMKTVIRHEGMKVIRNEILIPLLSEKNGYEITILKQASILSDGLIQYTNSEYGSYNVTTDRLDYYKDDTFEVNIIGEKFTVVTNGITYSGNIERSEEVIRFITEESSEIGKEFNGTVSVYDNGFIRNEITEVADDLTLNKSVSGKTYYGYSKENNILMYTDGENLYIIENDDKEYVGSYLTEDDGKYSVIINNRNLMEFSITSNGNLWYTMDGNTIPIGSLNYEKAMGKYIRGFVPSGEELIINDDGTYVFKNTNIQESGRWLYSNSEDKIYLYVDKVNELPIFEYTKDGFGIMS